MRQPPARVPRGPRAAPRWAVLAALTCGALLIGPAALAHDALAGTDPPDGSVVDAAPSQVVLTFAAEQAPVGAEVVVTGPDGARWSDGEPVVAGRTVTQALRAGLPNGECTVAWRSVAQDGHPVTGSFTFEVADPDAGPAEPTGTDEPTETDEPEVTVPAETVTVAPSEGGTGATAWWVAGAVVVVAAGAGVLLARRRGAARG